MADRIKRIGGKYYDVGTSNASFLQVAKDLQTVGVKNYYFMLEIIDPSVVGVDPHSKVLSNDLVSRVITECARNPWYYLREVALIPEQGGVACRYKANRGNIAQAWCILHGIDSWLCLTRQKGKTQSALAIEAWAYNFGTTNSAFIFINKDGDNAKANLNRLKDQIDLLPLYMRFEMAVDDETGKIIKETDNATSYKHPITNNSIVIKSKATSYDKALSLARGLTAPILHFDEPEFTDHIKTIVANSVSTYQTAAENARKNGAMYARIFTCTPGDLDTAAGKEAQQILAETTKWSEKMYDMNPTTLKEYVEKNGNGIVYIEYSYKQIGETEEWLRTISNKIGDPLTVKREILLQRIHGSSDSPFDQEDIDYIGEVMQAVTREIFLLEHFRFDLYVDNLDKNMPYLVGVDCSTGTNGDNNAITIINPYTIKPEAEFKCPYIGETDFEELIKELVRKVIPRAILIIERNSVGDSLIDHLLHSPFVRNLYHDKNKDLVENNIQRASTVQSMLENQAAQKKFYGVWTGPQSRQDMMAILIRHMAEFKDNFVTKNITEDIAALVQKSSGKIEAGPGFHDDSIMSYLIAMYVFYHGNNLARFGFIKGSNPLENQNQGLRLPTDASDILPKGVADAIKKEEEFKQANDWEKIMRDAVYKAQQESFQLAQSGMIQTPYAPETDNFSDNYTSIPLSFFDEIN